MHQSESETQSPSETVQCHTARKGQRESHGAKNRVRHKSNKPGLSQSYLFLLHHHITMQGTVSLASVFVLILTTAHPYSSTEIWRNRPSPYLLFSQTLPLTCHPVSHTPASKRIMKPLSPSSWML